METIFENNLFLLKKHVDWSLLTDGMTIPIEFLPLMHSLSGGNIQLGENRPIKIVIEEEAYDAVLNNVAFNRRIYTTHKELLQIRYSHNTPIAKKLQNVFSDSYEYLLRERQKIENRRKHIKLPKEQDAYIALYATSERDVFVIDCFPSSIVINAVEELNGVTESEYESLDYELVTDNTASIITKKSLQRVRCLDRSIGDSLKKLYDYRCQVTGEKIGEKYGDVVIEVHHIDYFTKSHNNDSSNLIILSPNFHRIIHKNNPIFNKKTLSFDFPNGIHQKLVLNKHLGF